MITNVIYLFFRMEGIAINDYAKRRSRFFLFIVISYIVLLTILCVTRFSLISYILGNHTTRQYSYNLIPFKSITDNWNRIGKLSWDAFGNMLMFIPLGVIFSLFAKKPSALLAGFYCFATSLGIELFQYIFSTGAVDVDDVILNTIGGLIGIFLYHIIKNFCQRKSASTKDIVEIATTILLPFLMFYIADMTFGRGKYYFNLWHAVPIIAYFGIIHFAFLKDFSKKGLVIYYIVAFVISFYFFSVFL